MRCDGNALKELTPQGFAGKLEWASSELSTPRLASIIESTSAALVMLMVASTPASSISSTSMATAKVAAAAESSSIYSKHPH